MKRPVAELLTMTLQAGAESERAHYEHEAWQILRRKQGYVTHRIYARLHSPLERMVYAEWDSAKAADGARQHLQGTPLARRARALLAHPPQRLVLELSGPITSTKGLDLPREAIAANAIGHLAAEGSGWREIEEKLWQTLASQPGYMTHVLFRGLSDRRLVGSFSHWQDADAFEKALAQAEKTGTPVATALAAPMEYVVYSPVDD